MRRERRRALSRARWLLVPVFATGLLAGTADRVQAQGRGVGLEVNAGYYTLGGDDFRGIDEGFGFEALGSYAWPGGFAVGVGAGIGFHDAEASEDAVDTDIDLTGIFAQPTYRFNVPGEGPPHVHPFVGLRVGYARLSSETEQGEAEVEASASGFSAGGLGGVEVWLGDEVGVTGSVLFDFLSLGDREVDGDTQTGTDASGSRLGFRGGLKVRFP